MIFKITVDSRNHKYNCEHYKIVSKDCKRDCRDTDFSVQLGSGNFSPSWSLEKHDYHL